MQIPPSSSKRFNEDAKLREQLREVDSLEDVDVTSYEAEFLDSVLFKYTGPLSGPQRLLARQIIDRYLS